MKQVIVTTAFSALAALATAGWVRQPAAPQPAPQPAPYGDSMYAQPAAMSGYAANPALYSPGVRYFNGGQPSYDAPAPVLRRALPAQRHSVAPRSAVTRQVVRERPFSHSAAIVAGGAGAGAAIGALAGGGKGAGIGAISGGLAGLVYDRLTHKKMTY